MKISVNTTQFASTYAHAFSNYQYCTVNGFRRHVSVSGLAYWTNGVQQYQYGIVNYLQYSHLGHECRSLENVFHEFIYLQLNHMLHTKLNPFHASSLCLHYTQLLSKIKSISLVFTNKYSYCVSYFRVVGTQLSELITVLGLIKNCQSILYWFVIFQYCIFSWPCELSYYFSRHLEWVHF